MMNSPIREAIAALRAEAKPYVHAPLIVRTRADELNRIADALERLATEPDKGALIEEADKDGFNAAGRPLCPFCSKPWTADMVSLLAEASTYGCPSGGYDLVGTATLKIACDGCGRLLYSREVSTDDEP